MDEKQFKVERSKLDVKNAESKLREAQKNCDQGYSLGLSEISQANLKFEKEYARLKEEVNRAQIQVDLEKVYLTLAESDQERGFEK